MSLRRARVLTFFVVAIISAVLVCLPQTAWGQGFQPVSPDELKLTSEPQAPGVPAIILYRQVDRDDNGHTTHEDNYLRIKILTEEGRRYADIEVPFFKGSQNVVNVRARTIRPDGSIANFDGKVFEKYLVKGRGVRYLAKTFTLPDVQVGGIIEYSYTVDFSEKYIFDSHWVLSQELFTKRARFSLKPYQNSYGPLALRWTWQGVPPGSEPQQVAGRMVLMEVTNIPAFQIEDFMPPETELQARVDFIYSEDPFEPDPDKFWKKTGKKLNDRLENFVGKRKAMEQAVAQIVSPSDPPEVKLHKIYSKVQQIRNTSYELEKTEQEEKREKEKPVENVEDLWKRGHGSGMQLTWLFLGLARAAGFEAYGCWVSDRRHYFFNPKLEETDRLDTNVVLVKLNGKDVYFDPGAAFTPFGMLTWSETGVAGLRLDKDGGTWIRTTLPQSSESRIERKANLKLTDTGDLEGKLTVTHTGLEAMYQRLEERNADEVSRKKVLEDLVRQEIPAATEVELTNKPDWSSSEPPLVAEFDLKIPGWASSAGRRAVVPVAIFTVSEKRVFEHANRVHPIYFEYPFEKMEDVTIELPEGWQVSTVPPPHKPDGHVVVYSLNVEANKRTLHVTRLMSVDALLLEQKYYGALRNVFQSVRTGDEEQIVLQPGAATAHN